MTWICPVTTYICFKLFWIYLSYIWKTPLTISAYPPNLRINGRFFHQSCLHPEEILKLWPVRDEAPSHTALNVYFYIAALWIIHSCVAATENHPTSFNHTRDKWQSREIVPVCWYQHPPASPNSNPELWGCSNCSSGSACACVLLQLCCFRGCWCSSQWFL